MIVHAAASGVGTALLQLLKLRGAHAVATAGSADKLALCRELGAQLAVNYKDEVSAVHMRNEMLPLRKHLCCMRLIFRTLPRPS